LLPDWAVTSSEANCFLLQVAWKKAKQLSLQAAVYFMLLPSLFFEVDFTI